MRSLPKVFWRVTKLSTFIAVTLWLSVLWAEGEWIKEFGDLGGNESLLEKAKQLNPEEKIEVVQKRSVPRTLRSEIGFSWGRVTHGEPYAIEQPVGLQYHFHINPRWSISASYSYYFNDISTEGRRLIDVDHLIPAADFPSESFLGGVSWYPMYGKLNLLGKTIIHYDLYLTLAVGTIGLKSGATPIRKGAVGVGVWLNQDLSLRAEIQNTLYNASIFQETSSVNTISTHVSLGYLL